jgi:hypothetical protein
MEIIPRMMFSIKVELEFFAADRVKHERRKKQGRCADVNNINHRFCFKNVNVQGIASIPTRRSKRSMAATHIFS